MFDQDDKARLREAQRQAQRLTEQARSETDEARERMREAVKAFSDFRRREIEAEVRRIMSAALGIDLAQPGWRGWLAANVRRRIEKEIIARRELSLDEFRPIDLGRPGQAAMPNSGRPDVVDRKAHAGTGPIRGRGAPGEEAGTSSAMTAGNDAKHGQQGLF